MPSETTTRLPEPGAPDALFVVDVSGYVFRAYHALPPLSSPAGEPTHAVLGVTTMLQKLIQDQRPAMLAVAMDSRTRSFRHELYPEYKANRPKPPDDLKQQMHRVAEVIRALEIPVFQQDGMEADDVIASVVARARAQGLRVVIVSADKDLLQLVGPDVIMYDTGRNKIFGEPETVAKLGVPPAQVRDYLALVGDSSDNVPGVPSVGPKTAVKLLGEHGGLEAVLAAAGDIKRKGLREKLLSHADEARLSYRLVTLDSELDMALDPDRLRVHMDDTGALRKLYVELGFSRLLAQLPDTSSAGGEEVGAPAATSDASKLGGEVQVVLTDEQLGALSTALASAEWVALMSVSDDGRTLWDSPVGVGIAWQHGAVYIPLAHRYLGVPTCLDAATLAAGLGAVMSNADVPKACADGKRELLAWGAVDVALAGIRFDVGLASYLIDAERHGHSLAEVLSELFQLELPSQEVLLPKRRSKKASLPSDMPVEEIAGQVGEFARAILACREPLMTRLQQVGGDQLLLEMELPLSEVLARMERTGVRVDSALLSRQAQRAAEQLAALEARCMELAGHEFNVASPRQLETILFDELGLPVIKRTKTARSTDHGVLEELAIHHELPAAILEHRMLAKLKNTYLDALPRVVSPKTGRIHSDFRQTVAATGRLSSVDPNLQNIPIRTETGRAIREAFVPQEGWVMTSADYSQIELRVLAHISGDQELIGAFATGEDVHVRTARALFGVDAEGVTREMRGQAKTVNFAVIYGQTQFALARNLRIERAQAARYIRAFFEQYSGVQAYMDRVVEEGREAGFVKTLCGRARRLPDLRSSNRVRRQAAERVARNTPIQGTAADIIKLAMLAVDRAIAQAGLGSRMLLTVHDELVFEAPPEERHALGQIVKEQMEGVMALDVPLVVEVGFGHTWGEAH